MALFSPSVRPDLHQSTSTGIARPGSGRGSDQMDIRDIRFRALVLLKFRFLSGTPAAPRMQQSQSVAISGSEGVLFVGFVDALVRMADRRSRFYNYPIQSTSTMSWR